MLSKVLSCVVMNCFYSLTLGLTFHSLEYALLKDVWVLLSTSNTNTAFCVNTSHK